MFDGIPHRGGRHDALINQPVEQRLLGLLLTKPQYLAALPATFDVQHYAVGWNAEIHTVLVEVGRPNMPAALAVMHAWAINDTERREYVAALVSKAPGYTSDDVVITANIVTDLHRRRGMVALASSMHESAFANTEDGSADGMIAQALCEMEHLVGGSGVNRKSMSLNEAMDAALLKADEACKRGGPAGLSTGFPSVDEMLGGMEDGTLNVIGGRPGTGKAQPLTAKVLRQDGIWACMGDLRMGDHLASVDGAPSRVAAIHPRGVLPVFDVTLSDGRTTKVCGDHLWRVMYRDWDAPRVISTTKLREMLTRTRYQKRLSVEVVSGHFGESADLPLDPYVLGVMLGDGSFRSTSPRLTTPDIQVVEEVQARLGGTVEVRRVVGSYAYNLTSRSLPGRIIEDGCAQENRTYADLPHLGRRKFWPRTVYPVIRALRQLGLDGLKSEHKFVPDIYLSASRQDRLDMLRGLLDTDGTVGKVGGIQFSSASLALAENVQTLVRSLGGLCSIASKRPFYTYKRQRLEGLPAWICNIRHPQGETLFLLKRKSDRAVRGHNAKVSLNVISVMPCGEEEVRCITVTHGSSLYVTDGYTVTHNSAWGHQVALHAARQGIGVLEISLEMSSAELGRRALSVMSGVPVWAMKKGRHEPYAKQLIEARRTLADLPMTIEDGGGLTASMISLKARAAHRRHGLGLIMVDHLHIVRPDDANMRSGPTWAVGQVSGAMKRLAKEFACPVLLLAQLNRGVEARDDKRPGLADLRESGAIEQDADAVGFMYRAEMYLQREPEKTPTETLEKFSTRRFEWAKAKDEAGGKAELIFAKVRDGAPGTVHLNFHGETTSFSEIGS